MERVCVAVKHPSENEIGRLRDAGLEVRVIDPVGGDPTEHISEMDGCQYIIVYCSWDEAALRRVAGSMRMIARLSVGLDDVDLQAAARLGIAVSNAPGANAEAVAEHAIALMLALVRDLVSEDRKLRAGEWNERFVDTLMGKCVGLIGFGQTARAVARRLSGFGASVVAYDPNLDAEVAAALGVEPVSLDELCARADVLSLHTPLTNQTRGLVDEAFLLRIKPGAYLVNTSRGGVIEDAALIRALENGRLRAAALDVFSEEPLPMGHPLMKCDHLLLTPHDASNTRQAYDSLFGSCVDNVIAFSRGELRNVVNAKELRFARQGESE